MERTAQWDMGYRTAFLEWVAAQARQEKPEFRNPFPIGTDEEIGYEAFVEHIEFGPKEQAR